MTTVPPEDPQKGHLCPTEIPEKFARPIRGIVVVGLGLGWWFNVARMWAARATPHPLAWIGLTTLTISLIVFGILWRNEFRPDHGTPNWAHHGRYFAACLAAIAISLNVALVPWLSGAVTIGSSTLTLIAATFFYFGLKSDAVIHENMRNHRPQTGYPRIDLALGLALVFMLAAFGFSGASAYKADQGAKPNGRNGASTPTPTTRPTSSAGGSTSTSVSNSTTTTQTSAPSCSLAPGGDSTSPISSSPIRSWMEHASQAEAAPEYGCLGPLEVNGGYYIQRFDYLNGILLGSSLGAGVVGDIYSDAMKLASGGTPSLQTLDGQPVDRIDCAQKRADFQPIVGENSAIIGLYGRARKSLKETDGITTYFPAYEVDPSLLNAFSQEIKTAGIAYTPVAPASNNLGTVTQFFVDPNSIAQTYVELQAPQGTPDPLGLTLGVLWSACNPGIALPRQYIFNG
jgi:hypothetical protein